VTHTLYLDREMEKVRREAGALQSNESTIEGQRTAAPPRVAPANPAPRGAVPQRESPAPARAAHTADLADDVRHLREEMTGLKRGLAAVQAELESTTVQLRGELDELIRQLGN
jgi:hypothetical protein